MPVFAKKVFAVGPKDLGRLMMASGIGGLVGSLAIVVVLIGLLSPSYRSMQ